MDVYTEMHSLAQDYPFLDSHVQDCMTIDFISQRHHGGNQYLTFCGLISFTANDAEVLMVHVRVKIKVQLLALRTCKCLAIFWPW